ncbi:TIGR00341 family protein [Candidatus Falkowbacteria bacterium HGW-Falkowbacteria-1]|uniref:TIGR00341 family protein n=1 Tax=Candidatus Falkowbacteria bacterium HGW-Falkowbacteria-1 TaxID=2013768 RepID=A0A2N2E9D5_9BACT|nr:MAG: TIGR00341 family protein [Candidatus Falkowbacteria bacterium HGW-Falkowbacteria-1]
MINFREIIRVRDISKENKKTFISSIIDSSAPKLDFYLMVSLSSIITSLGLIADNLALVIAGMIVAPLLSPILAISLGCVITNFKVFWRSFKIFALSLFVAVFVSTLVGTVFNINVEEILLIKEMNISWLTFAIALTAGITASYAWTRTNSKDYLSGIAIAVTIIPPLTSIGLIIPSFNLELLSHVSMFFLMNVLGIFLGGLIVFSLIHLQKVRRTAIKEVEKEEKELNN